MDTSGAREAGAVGCHANILAHKKKHYKTKKYRCVNESHTSVLSASNIECNIVRSECPLRIMRQCSVWTIQTLKMVRELCVQRWTTDTINKHNTGDVAGVVLAG